MIAASGSPANCRASSTADTSAGLQPAVGGHRPPRASMPSTSRLGKLAAHLAKPVGLLERQRADHDALAGPGRAVRRIVCLVANAAAQFAGHARPPPGSPRRWPSFRPGRRGRRPRSTRCRHSAPCVDPVAGHGGRVVAEDRFAVDSRPAAGGRTCRRADRSLARSACRASEAVAKEEGKPKNIPQKFSTCK